MIPGYHIDANHGYIALSRMLTRRPHTPDAIDHGVLAYMRLELVKDICGHPASVYDAGSEHFREHCDTDGIRVSGTDPLDPLVSYDVATLYDVFEHLTEDEQRQLLETLVCRHLVISVPWCHVHELGDEWFWTWRHRRPDEHLSHWTPGSLCSLLRIYNYHPVFVGNPEDSIRKVEGEWWPNILTVIFKRI